MLVLHGYHQIRVRKTDQEKLAFFTPNSKTSFKVTPFHSKSTFTFYTAMMQFLRDDWLFLFNETKHNVSLDHSPTKIICDDRIIIDDIFSFSNDIPTLLHYFPVLHKYLQRIGFHLSWINTTSLRIEWSTSAMILFLSESPLQHLSSPYLKNGHSHHMVSLSYHLSGYDTFIIGIYPDLKPISNRSGNCNETIITRIFPWWDKHHP